MAALIACLSVIACAGCSTGAESPSTVEPSLVRASSSAPATVGVEEADLYRAREVQGVVERRPERTVRSSGTGRFTRALGIREGKAVRRGALLGTVRACEAPAGSAAQQSRGASTDATSSSATASPTGTVADPQATAVTCLPRAHAVRAPVAGTVTTVAEGEVTQGATIATVRPPGYVIRATITDPSALYDLMRPPSTGKTRVVGGPAGFTVRYERRTYDPSDRSVTLVLAVPDDVTVIEGLRTSTAFVVSRRTAVPTLPVTAVQGTTGVGQVVVVEGDRNAVTNVELGQHDGARVEVTGLPEGARVLRFPLASDFETP